MKLIKDNEKGKTYLTSDFKIAYRKKGSISGDNKINPKETIYLITGSAKVTLEKEEREVNAPTKIEFPARTYHKIEAITDIGFIIID